MKRIECLFLALITVTAFNHAFGQDEGVIRKAERVSKGKSIFLSGGPSSVIWSNPGDYSRGLNLEGGFFRRMGPVLSIGTSLSYTRFYYDDWISDSFNQEDAEGNNVFHGDAYEARIVYQEGGDIKLVSANFIVKANFIPWSDRKKFNPYGIAKPFLTMVNRSEITADSELWYFDNYPPGDPSNWTFSEEEHLTSESPGREHWAAESKLSAGISTGLGLEYVLPSGLAFFAQGTLVLTLPLSYVATKEFRATIADGYDHADYPLVKKGFTHLNISLGAAFNF